MPRRKEESTPEGDAPVLTVAQLVAMVSDDLAESYGTVMVRGEIGDITLARSGHVYFTLKDERADAAVPAVMFKGAYARRRFDLASGRVVVAAGQLSIYAPRGSFQVIVREVFDAGEGLLALRFEELKRKLAEEGLTAGERKRPLPSLPRTIGIVTSLEGAALQDMLRVLRGRFPARVVVSPSPVQGEEAPAALVAALGRLARVPGLDVAIVGRGGGSAEDLACFNDEGLARAVAAFPVPVISAVGHEVDWTICDLVADARAPTPTAAAQAVIPAEEELRGALRACEVLLSRGAEGAINAGRTKVYALRQRMAGPERAIMTRRQRLDELGAAAAASLRALVSRRRRALEGSRALLLRLHPSLRLRAQRLALEKAAAALARGAGEKLHAARARFLAAARELGALSPLSVLSRGYAIATRRADGAIVARTADARPGDELDVRVADGSFPCVVGEKGRE